MVGLDLGGKFVSRQLSVPYRVVTPVLTYRRDEHLIVTGADP